MPAFRRCCSHDFTFLLDQLCALGGCRRFLIPVPVEQETALPMTVVLNWMAGLKRSTTQ
jgi:hypothetical protein